MKGNKVIRLCALVIGVGAMASLTVQDVHTFLTEDKGPEYFRTNPAMILVCLAIGIAGGLTAHLVLEWRDKRGKTPNQASDGTSEPASGADSSAHQG